MGDQRTAFAPELQSKEGSAVTGSDNSFTGTPLGFMAFTKYVAVDDRNKEPYLILIYHHFSENAPVIDNVNSILPSSTN